jgi:glucose-6-phosphate 1-epimerase
MVEPSSVVGGSTDGSKNESAPMSNKLPAGVEPGTSWNAGVVAIDACIPQTLTAADGAELIACAHGGHVLGWTPAGGRPRLWLSPTAACGPGLAIRGGVPVIFPQFAGRGPLPKHGLARDRGWQVEPSVQQAEAAQPAGAAVEWRATLTDDAGTRAIWPHRFRLTLSARAGGDRLEIGLSVRNDDDAEWAFAAALHTYLALGDPGALIRGLGGRTAEDNTAPGRLTTLGAAGAPLTATQARDVAVPDVDEPLLLDDPVLGPLVIRAAGFPDRVVWNPGPGHGLTDVPEGAEAEFVCIEPAALQSIIVEPGSTWNGNLSLQSGNLIL